MATLPNDDNDANLSLEDSLRKRRLEVAYGFNFDNCSKDDVVQILLQSNRKNELLEASLKESLLNFKNVDFEVTVPEQPKPALGLFTNLLVQHLYSLGSNPIYFKGEPHAADKVANAIIDETEEGITWINLALSGAIQFLSDNQLQEFSDSDINLVNLIVDSEELSIYTATKVLKRLIDRISSSAFKANQAISNSTFTENKAFMQLLEAIYFTGYPQEGN